MYRISRILLKYFTFGTNDEESRLLNRWREESDRNERLFNKIGSRDFLGNAMDPKHRKAQEEQWSLLEKKIMFTRRRERMIKSVQWAAAILIPVVFVMFYLLDREDAAKPRIYTASEFPVSSKAVIHLAEGGEIVILQDTVFQKEMKTVLLENRFDTIRFLPKEMEEDFSDKVYRIEVPRGGEYVARLEDGTIVHMDAESELVIPQKFERDSRVVELSGHAYFVVTKDTTRPFIVKSGDLKIQVLGTEFDFNAYRGQDITTTLVKGSVEVSYLQSKCRLKPDQQAKINTDGEIEVSDVDVYPFVAWKYERIVFINQTLESIMQILARWYNVEPIFLSNEIKQECFTLDIEKYGEIAPVLKSIEKTNKVYFEIGDKQILVHKK
jgi:anti-sigma factor